MIPDGIRAVFFDHDDTLVGTIKAKWAQHTYIAEHFYGRQLTEATLREHWGKPLTVMAPLLYGIDDFNDAQEKINLVRERFPKELFAVTVPLLEELKARGLLVGLVTATTRESWEHDIAELGVSRDFFDFAQAADDFAFHKPDPRVFDPAKQWLAERGVEPSQVLYVGDSYKDMDAALGAGFAFLGVQTGLVGEAAFTAVGGASVASIADFLSTEADGEVQ